MLDSSLTQPLGVVLPPGVGGAAPFAFDNVPTVVDDVAAVKITDVFDFGGGTAGAGVSGAVSIFLRFL